MQMDRQLMLPARLVHDRSHLPCYIIQASILIASDSAPGPHHLSDLYTQSSLQLSGGRTREAVSRARPELPCLLSLLAGNDGVAEVAVVVRLPCWPSADALLVPAIAQAVLPLAKQPYEPRHPLVDILVLLAKT